VPLHHASHGPPPRAGEEWIVPAIHAGFTTIAVEKHPPSAKNPAIPPAAHGKELANLVLRPHSNRTRSPASGEPGLNPGNEGFLREVDDALREQEVIDAFRRYGMIAGAAILAILVALGAYLWWDNHRTAQLGEQGEQLTLALDQVEAGKLDAGAGQLAGIAASGSPGAKTAARLMQAGILVEQNKVPEARKLFAAVAADADAPQPYRDLATIRDVALGFDGMAPQDVVARLKPLAVPGKPFFGSAGELLGVAYIKQGRNDLAGPLFAAISREKAAPDSLRRRARQMAGLLGVDAVDDVNEAANSAGGEAAPAAAPAPAAQ